MGTLQGHYPTHNNNFLKGQKLKLQRTFGHSVELYSVGISFLFLFCENIGTALC
jgi:hypothetical protein